MPNEFSPGMSLAVRTATRPDVASTTALRFPSAKAARTWGERTTRIQSASGGACPPPRRLRRFRRMTRRHIQNGVEDLDVTGAAAQHAPESVLHGAPIGVPHVSQAIDRGHQHAGRADPALGRAVDEKGLA